METLRVAVCDDDRVYLEQIKEEIKEYIAVCRESQTCR